MRWPTHVAQEEAENLRLVRETLWGRDKAEKKGDTVPVDIEEGSQMVASAIAKSLVASGLPVEDFLRRTNRPVTASERKRTARVLRDMGYELKAKAMERLAEE